MISPFVNSVRTGRIAGGLKVWRLGQDVCASLQIRSGNHHSVNGMRHQSWSIRQCVERFRIPIRQISPVQSSEGSSAACSGGAEGQWGFAHVWSIS